MMLTDLNHEQQVALVALIEAVAISGGEVSEDEGKEIAKIAETLGEDSYRSLLDEAEARFADVQALKDFLLTIADKGARGLIFGAALDESMVEITFDGADAHLLDWLAKAWDIKVDIQPEE